MKSIKEPILADYKPGKTARPSEHTPADAAAGVLERRRNWAETKCRQNTRETNEVRKNTVAFAYV